MAIALKANTPEQLRRSIIEYLEFCEKQERECALLIWRASKWNTIRTARANFAQSLLMELKDAKLVDDLTQKFTGEDKALAKPTA